MICVFQSSSRCIVSGVKSSSQRNGCSRHTSVLLFLLTGLVCGKSSGWWLQAFRCWSLCWCWCCQFVGRQIGRAGGVCNFWLTSKKHVCACYRCYSSSSIVHVSMYHVPNCTVVVTCEVILLRSTHRDISHAAPNPHSNTVLGWTSSHTLCRV